MGAGASLGRAVYRVRQFAGALSANWRPLSRAEEIEARTYLPLDAWPLFDAMGTGDQRHSLKVLQALLATGNTDPALLQAALVHDCAKHGGGVRIWHRVAVVLLHAFWPDKVTSWRAARAPARGSWQYAFWAHLNHPRRGAEMAATAGCDERAVWLIAHHQDDAMGAPGAPTDIAALRALQAADDDN